MAEKSSKHIFQQKLWLGISNLLKEPSSQDPYQPVNYWYSENINTRTDPYALTLNPATVKESGGTVTDFVKWADMTPTSLTTYLIGDTGNIYSRTTSGSWSFLHKAANSHGNGLQYFYGDDYLYYPNDSNIGRYGPLSGTPTFSDDFLTAQGGVPQNTNSLALTASSSQYASAANSATLQITSDLTLEAYCYLNSLPGIGNSMVVLGKWDESGALRSYLMDIYAISGYFGSGSDGALTISVNTTDAPIDSACTGTAGNYTLSATNASFALGQVILIHQSQGTNAGQYERNVISGYTAGTITLQSPLKGSYTTGAQVLVIKQYTNVTVNSGVTWTAKKWNGTTGGILTFLASGILTVNGTILADGAGYNLGYAGNNYDGYQGEGTAGTGARTTAANGNGGGGGSKSTSTSGGGGGANATNNGTSGLQSGGSLGSSAGTTDLTTMVFGGQGGNGGTSQISDNNRAGKGGDGGGIIYLAAVTITLNSTAKITANGLVGANAPDTGGGGGGGGAGGSVLLKCQTATLGTNLVLANGALGGSALPGDGGQRTGGTGGDGRVAIDYLTSYTGTTTPGITNNQDSTLVTTATYQLRIGISNDGTNYEYLTQNIPNLTTGQWNRLSISWAAASSFATFYVNGSSIGTVTGTKTAISSNLSLLYIGAKKGASTIGSFLDGYIDDVRIWSGVQSSSNIYNRNNIELTGNQGGLKAYYKLDNSASDSSGNANTLTLQNSATYTTSVPFVDPSARLDIDQSYTTTGSTYAVPTTINEVTSDQLPFTPSYDPQKSMDINVSARGTGNWTLTIHDQTNRTIASKTIANANMASSGYQEFIWDSPWRIVIGKSYHAHITSSVNDGSIVSSSLNVLQSGGNATGDFHTYYQFLVTDTLFHPAIDWLNFMVIGNERYLAKWDGAYYSPNYIAFPYGTHVRCFGIWGIYLAIGVWQQASSGTPNVYDFPQGKIYFWDGISLTFNFSIDVPEGQVNSIFGMDSDLYYFAGYKGDLMHYAGSWANQSGSFNGTKIKRIPYLGLKDYVEVYPQAMANYQNMLYMGLGANTNSTTLPQGVYSWGSLYPDYPQSLAFEHIISTGNKGSTVKIGVVYPIQQKLLVSWKDGLGYGVDVIDPTAGVYHTQGLIQTNTIDGGYLYQNDLALKVRADHLALNTGEGVQVGYALDREATYESTASITDTLNKFTTNTISNGRATEMSFQAMLTGNGSSTPTLLSLATQTDSLTSEQAF